MDTSKVNEDHKELLQSVLSDEFGVGYTDQQKEQILAIYETLNTIPKKDWGKESTKETIDTNKK